jgi:hypothetical protein
VKIMFALSGSLTISNEHFIDFFSSKLYVHEMAIFLYHQKLPHVSCISFLLFGYHLTFILFLRGNRTVINAARASNNFLWSNLCLTIKFYQFGKIFKNIILIAFFVISFGNIFLALLLLNHHLFENKNYCSNTNRFLLIKQT